MPSNRLHRARILVHKPVGREYYRLVLRAPDAASTARPGQFVMLRVSENMDPLLARPFGISAVLSKTSIEIFYRVVGRGTALLTRLEPGHELDMLGPLGNGFPQPGKDVTPVMIAGGIGFPPLHFLSTRTAHHAHLFIGARNKECLPPAAIMKSFRESAEKVHVVTEDGSAGKKGTTIDLLGAYLRGEEKKSHFVLYACGPRLMLEAVSRVASEHLIRCYVSMEERMACGLGACMGCATGVKKGGYRRVCKEGPVFEAGEIDWSRPEVPAGRKFISIEGLISKESRG